MKKLRQERNPRKVPSSTEVLLLCISYRHSVSCPSEKVSCQWLPPPRVLCLSVFVKILVRWGRIHIKHRFNVLVYRHLFLSDFTWYVLSSNKPRFLPIIFIANKSRYSVIVGPDFGNMYRGADKSLARPGREQATATQDFDVRISYLLS